jgi:hypothetical protein
MITPNWNATKTAVLHHSEPHCACHSMQEGMFVCVSSRGDCSHQCNKCREQAFFSFSTKSDGTFAMSQKKQWDVGQFEAMNYFEQEGKMDKFTWSVLIFDNLKREGERGECNSTASSHHLDNNKNRFTCKKKELTGFK